MTLETSSHKAMKLSNSSEPAFRSLSSNKIINPCKKYEIQMNLEKLDLAKVKRIEAGILKFDQSIENNDDLVVKRLAGILKTARQPKKLDITCQECVELTNRGLDFLCEGIKRLTSLKDIKLVFAECDSMTDEGIQRIAKSLENLRSLQKLTLKFQTSNESTSLSDLGMKYLSMALKKFVSLRSIHLDLSKMLLSDLGIKYLSQGLKKMIHLKTLHLNLSPKSKITDKGIQTFTQNLKTLQDFESIDLCFRCFYVSDEGLTMLSQWLTKSSSLKHLGLYFGWWHNITDEGIELLGQNLKKINSLQSVNFDFRW